MFKEIDYQQTPLGAISLRCRSEPKLAGKLIYEVKLEDEFLMSSLFPEAEIKLAKLGLAALSEAGHLGELEVVVGGLGLGYTAITALENSAVSSLLVIDVMQAVINWHHEGLVPLGKKLTGDERVKLVCSDFFKLAADKNTGFYPTEPLRMAHAVLLDIDHSPYHWLNLSNSAFYTQAGLSSLASKLHPAGVFGLWSNDPPDDEFTQLLNVVFKTASAQRVTFENPYTGTESSNTVYLAQKK